MQYRINQNKNIKLKILNGTLLVEVLYRNRINRKIHNCTKRLIRLTRFKAGESAMVTSVLETEDPGAAQPMEMKATE